MTRPHFGRGGKPPVPCVAACCGLLAVAALVAVSGCPTGTHTIPFEVGLTGFVGLELGSSTGDGTPVAEPVAVWLAPSAYGPFGDGVTVVPLAGAAVDVTVANVLVGSTATNGEGLWELTRRPETRVDVTVTGPAGLFGTLAPAAVVRERESVVAAAVREPWPAQPLRVSRDEVLGGVSVIIEEARSG